MARQDQVKSTRRRGVAERTHDTPNDIGTPAYVHDARSVVNLAAEIGGRVPHGADRHEEEDA